MFELYQTKQVHVKFIPYKWEFPGGLAPPGVIAYPTWSIIDPENNPPTTGIPNSLYSYGNCRDTAPYKEHRRSMTNYTDLGLSK